MRAIVFAAVILALGGQAYGQTPAQQTEAMAGIQKQFDRQQAPAVAKAGLFGNTDGATVVGSTLYVFGWAFECGTGSTDGVELEIDGVIRPTNSKPDQERYDRTDIQPLFIGGCPKVPVKTGVMLQIDISAFTPFLPHTVALRYRNAAGISKRFNGRFVYVCGYYPDDTPIVCHGPE